MIDTIEEMCDQARTVNCCGMKDKKPKNDAEFDKIVKFLNAQKAVMDYAGLN